MTGNTAACRWTANAPCWVSATQTAPCAGTSGKRFCPTTRNWKQPCRLCPQNAASAAASRFRSVGAESTALTTARKHPGKSRPQPECANSGAKRLCNALALKSRCSTTTFCAAFAKTMQLHSPSCFPCSVGYRSQNQNGRLVYSINFSHERNHDYENISGNTDFGFASRTQESEVQWQKTKAAKTM